MATENADVVAKLRQLEERLDKLEREERREERPRNLWEALMGMVPREVRAHLLAARREQLLAVEAYIDHLIARLDEAEKRVASRERRRIEVQ